MKHINALFITAFVLASLAATAGAVTYEPAYRKPNRNEVVIKEPPNRGVYNGAVGVLAPTGYLPLEPGVYPVQVRDAVRVSPKMVVPAPLAPNFEEVTILNNNPPVRVREPNITVKYYPPANPVQVFKEEIPVPYPVERPVIYKEFVPVAVPVETPVIYQEPVPVAVPVSLSVQPTISAVAPAGFTAAAPAAGMPVVGPGYFNTNVTTLGPNLKKYLTAKAKEIKAVNYSYVAVDGNADPSEKTPASVSEKRAKNVAEYLNKQGIPLSKIRYRSWGDANPAESNDTADGRKMNRRVEVVVY